jgi:hypothetical protein
LDVEGLKVSFEKALISALGENRDELRKRLSRRDPIFNAYTSKLKELQALGILNNHEIFNPFERKATRAFTQDDLDEMKALNIVSPNTKLEDIAGNGLLSDSYSSPHFSQT